MQIFENIIGQDFVIDLFNKEIDNKQLSHAYLFSGIHGCGKLQTALNLSYWLLYKTKEVDDKNFKKLENGLHPDVKLYKPEGTNGYLISQIKEIVLDSAKAPIQNNHKIYIVEDADKLGTSGANAFLKTLEEPNPYITIILITDNENNVLPTIVSRCQTVHFKNLPTERAINYIVDITGESRKSVKDALDLFEGDKNQTLDFLENQDMKTLKQKIDRFFDDLRSYSDWDVLQVSTDIEATIKEIGNTEKKKLDNQLLEVVDVLGPQAIKNIEKENKRKISAKQIKMMNFVCACMKYHLLNNLKDVINKSDNLQNNGNDKINNKNVTKKISAIDEIGKYQQYLAYNINLQNLCDVIFLNVAQLLR